MIEIALPHHYEPRPYQLPLLRALDLGAIRAVAVWHRRAGKDKTCLNYMARKTQERVGAYFYCYPEYAQGKKAIWEGRDRDGFPYLAHFPTELIKSRDNSEMKLTLTNGSLFQVVGISNINALMSTNPVGIVLAEYSLQDPGGWDYLRPILAENGGWALFNYVPRGKNHGYHLFELAQERMAAGDGRWFCSRLSVVDTGMEYLADEERRDGMDEELIQQEYYCSFSGVQQGAVFAKQLDEAERDGRICGVPWQPELTVNTWWDIGASTAVWFTQDAGREIHVIDYYECVDAGVGVEHHIAHLSKMPYVWGRHYGPHDIETKQFAANGRSSKEVAEGLGFRFETVPRIGHKRDAITAGRVFMRRCWFDRTKTERGRDALISYHYKWNEQRKVFSSEPDHDWSSHGADAYMQLATGHRTMAVRDYVPREPQYRQMPTGTQDLSWMAT